MFWIDVNERLPEFNQWVIVNIHRKTMPDKVLPSKLGNHSFLGPIFYVGGFKETNVTHWMPLPEPVN